MVVEEPGEEPKLYRQDTGELVTDLYVDPFLVAENNEHPVELPKGKESAKSTSTKMYKDIDDLIEKLKNDDKNNSTTNNSKTNANHNTSHNTSNNNNTINNNERPTISNSTSNNNNSSANTTNTASSNGKNTAKSSNFNQYSKHHTSNADPTLNLASHISDHQKSKEDKGTPAPAKKPHQNTYKSSETGLANEKPVKKSFQSTLHDLKYADSKQNVNEKEYHKTTTTTTTPKNILNSTYPSHVQNPSPVSNQNMTMNSSNYSSHSKKVDPSVATLSEINGRATSATNTTAQKVINDFKLDKHSHTSSSINNKMDMPMSANNNHTHDSNALNSASISSKVANSVSKKSEAVTVSRNNLINKTNKEIFLTKNRQRSSSTKSNSGQNKAKKSHVSF